MLFQVETHLGQLKTEDDNLGLLRQQPPKSVRLVMLRTEGLEAPSLGLSDALGSHDMTLGLAIPARPATEEIAVKAHLLELELPKALTSKIQQVIAPIQGRNLHQVVEDAELVHEETLERWNALQVVAFHLEVTEWHVL
jgi:hypothetical protein